MNKYIEKNIYKSFLAFKGQDCISISSYLKELKIDRIAKDYRYIKFSNTAMIKATMFMKLKGIKYQTQLTKHLKNNKEDASNLGFSGKRKSIPDQRTVSHFMNHILDKETKITIDLIVKKIETVAEKFGIVFDTEILKSRKPKKRGTKRTFHNRKDRKIRELCRFVKKKIYPHINLNLHHNTIYKKKNFLDLLVHIAMTKDFTENGSKTFKETTTHKVPDADTLLYHIKKYEDIKAVEEMFVKVFEVVYKIAKKANVFQKRKVDVAIDFTDWFYYGDKNDLMVVEREPERGTSHCFRFATINIVEAGERFTLLALPVGKFNSKERVVQKLIEYSKGKIIIRKIYVDRGFFTIDVINTLKKLKLKFLMPAIENKDIARLSESLPVHSVVTDYRMGKGSRYADFNLVILESKKSKKGKIPFATNLDINEGEADLSERLFGLYGKRWGVETSYRVKKGFRANTTSKNYIVRLFYFLFSTLLYNLWVIINMLISSSLLKKVSEVPLITAKLFGTILCLIFEPS